MKRSSMAILVILILTLVSCPLFAADMQKDTGVALQQNAASDRVDGVFPHASKNQVHRIVSLVSSNCDPSVMDCGTDVDNWYTEPGSGGCDTIHVCTLTQGCLFAVYGTCILTPGTGQRCKAC